MSVSLPVVAQRAPDFDLTDNNGQALRLSDYRGKVIALNFWATWCGPCKVEMPWFNELERKYESRGFVVIAIAMDQQGWPVVKPFLANVQVSYRVLMGNHRISRLYGGVDVLPTTFLIGRDNVFTGCRLAAFVWRNCRLPDFR